MCCIVVLIGDYTVLLDLLSYHARVESHDLLFCPEPTASHIEHQFRTYCTTSSICMQSLGAIQHLAPMELERELPSINTKRRTTHKTVQRPTINKDCLCLCRVDKCAAYTFSVNTICDMCRRERERERERVLVILYNGRSTDTLESLRHQRFRERIASSATPVHP